MCSLLGLTSQQADLKQHGCVRSRQLVEKGPLMLTEHRQGATHRWKGPPGAVQLALQTALLLSLLLCSSCCVLQAILSSGQAILQLGLCGLLGTLPGLCLVQAGLSCLQLLFHGGLLLCCSRQADLHRHSGVSRQHKQPD